VADDLDLLHLALAHGLPGVQQRVHHRVELLLRRVPRLEQVVVHVDQVDRLDRGVGVRVRGQQRPPRVGEQVHRLLQEVDAVHPRHPVVGQHDRHPPAAQLDLAQRLQRLVAGGGAHDLVVLAVPPAQVPGDRAGHGRVVVDGQHRGSAHGSPS
jgi:hypothetical protein